MPPETDPDDWPARLVSTHPSKDVETRRAGQSSGSVSGGIVDSAGIGIQPAGNFISQCHGSDAASATGRQGTGKGDEGPPFFQRPVALTRYEPAPGDEVFQAYGGPL